MTARSSSFLCPKRPNAPTSAAAFAHRLSSHRSSPSGPLASTPSAIVPAVQRLCSGIAPVLASPQCYLRHRCGSHPEHKNADYVLETPEKGGSEGQKRTKTPILCSGRPKMGVPEGKSAQKPRFCAREEGDWYREAQPLPSCKSPRTLLKYKYLITRQLTFEAALGELKSRPPRGPMCPRGA